MGIKILLADDSVTAQNMGKKILSEAGHEVVTVSNGAAAAKKIAEIKPELVLLDVFMPGYSGLELCEKLRNAAETSKIPVLLTVGRMEPYNAQDGARVKADGVIVKPFEATDLTAAVDRIADKVKPAKASADSPHGMKVVSKSPDAASAVAEPTTTADNFATKVPPHEEEKPYEKTVRLNAAHTQSILQDGPEAQESTPASQTSDQPLNRSVAPSAPDFQVGAAHAAELETFQAAPAITPETTPSAPSIPSFMSQYLPETQEPKTAEVNALAEPERSIHDQPTGAFPIHNDFAVKQSHNEIHGEHRQPEETVASVPELQLTAAAPVGDVPVSNEPGLELTRQSAESSVVVVPDPALETDLHRASVDFPTRFGTTEADIANQFLESLQHQTANSAEPADEFEARLNAAMEAYDPPSAELPGALASPNAELLKAASHFDIDSSATNDRFEKQVESAMDGFNLPTADVETTAIPEIVAEIIPEPSSHVATENRLSEFELAPRSEPPTSIEVPGSSEAVPNLGAFIESEPATDEIEIVAPEPDESVIEQMREGLAHHPVEAPHVEISEPAPMAMAAAASAASPMAPQSLAHEAEAEVGRAMAAAMGRDSSAVQPQTPGGPTETAASPGDANHLAGAVESVMKRELPGLVGKIMAELDLRKRS